MREVNLSQKLIETSRFTVSQHIQNTPLKEDHNKPKNAKTDLKPFLTILGTNLWLQPREEQIEVPADRSF